MVDARVFKEEVHKLLDELYTTQEAVIEESAQIIADCMANDGVVHIFGSGHSVGLGLDVMGRLGSLVPIHIMDMTDFVTKGGVPVEVYLDRTNIFERKPGVARDLYNLYDIKPQDVFIVISNSGINGIVIDIADLAKQNGHKVIIITSMKHTTAEDSRHPSGKKLYMFGDVVIDNCGPHGDALLPTNGIGAVTAVSSICNNCVAQSMFARVVQLLKEKGVELPVLTLDPVHDDAVKAKYYGRI